MAGARDYVSLRNGYKKQNDEKMQLNISPNSSKPIIIWEGTAEVFSVTWLGG